MNLLCVVLVLAASGSVMTALAIECILHRIGHRLRRVAPTTRITWLTVLLALPAIVGLVTVLVAFGPCLHDLAARVPDGCRSHGRPDFYLCMRMGMRDVPVAWLVTGLLASILTVRLVRGMQAFARARRALEQLRKLGRFDERRGVWVVPGNLAVVSGFFRGDIYVGERLEETLSTEAFSAVLAHERAHRGRRDLIRKLLARFLAAFVFGRVGTWLLDELDLAIEQACDAVAADELQDPVVVARSLLDMARRPTEPTSSFALAFCSTEDHLEARVRALCEPSWSSSVGSAVALSVAATMAAAGCILFDTNLHEMTETLFDRLLG